MKILNLAAALVALALVAQPTSAALVAHYTFDEGTGTGALDSSGNAAHAVQDSGTIGFVAQGAGPDDGHIGPFAGEFSSADLITPDILAGATEFTASVWVNLDNTNGYNGIFMSRVSNWGFASDGGDNFDYRYDNPGPGSDGPNSATGTKSAAVNVWTHLAMTWRNDGTGEYYLNGVQIGSKTGASTVYQDDAGSQNWYIGSDNDRRINAQIDDVAVWDVAFNANTIAKLYADGNNGINAAESVPEPTSVVLGLLGACGFAAVAMRRRLG